jgi:formate--tetrahydrofolate ligase
VVLVATVRALKMHGGLERSALGRPDAGAVARGLPNLEKHVENIQTFGEQPIVALNRFAADTSEEILVVERCCRGLGVPFSVSDHHARGGEGAEDLARALVASAEARQAPFEPLYQWGDPVFDKIHAVASRMYGAKKVVLTRRAERDLRLIERLGYAGLPVCIAKIPGSLSDDPALRGRPTDFEVTVREIQINAGAGFLVVLTGDILRMPGLPKRPLAERIDLEEGRIVGLE